MDATERLAPWREGVVLALYVSIVVLAELLALPEDFGSPDHQSPSLLGLVWGTAIGLTLAHWFAFQVAAVWFSGRQAARADLDRALYQVAGAMLVAAVTTVPILVADDAVKVEAAALGPALILGACGIAIGRSAGRSAVWSVAVGLLVVGAGFGVAVIKALLGH